MFLGYNYGIMLKRFVIFGVLTFVSIGFLPCQSQPLGTPKQGVAEPGSSQDGGNQSKPQQREETTPEPLPSAPQPTTPDCDEACQQGRQNLAIQGKLEWFTGVLAIVGILQVGTMAWQACLLKGTLGAIKTQATDSTKSATDTLAEMRAQRLQTANVMGKQSYEISQQTGAIYASSRAAEKSAEAALINTQAVINAERPWIVVIVEPVVGPMGGFNVNIKNKGRTPAIIRGHYMGCAAVENIDKLPQKAPFGKGSMVQDRLVMPDETVWVRWFDSRIFKQFLGEDFRFLPGDGHRFVFGKVLYRDMLNTDANVMHETRWIGIYEGPSEEDGPFVTKIEGVGVTPEYENYT